MICDGIQVTYRTILRGAWRHSKTLFTQRAAVGTRYVEEGICNPPLLRRSLKVSGLARLGCELGPLMGASVRGVRTFLPADVHSHWSRPVRMIEDSVERG